MTFKEITDAIEAKLGISRLNPMQAAIAGINDNRIMLLAPTGSGKTVAFAIAALMRLKPQPAATTGLVIVPSRELALQVGDVLRQIASTGQIRVVTVYGGHSVVDEKSSLSVAPDIVVGTPGRILDHINRGRINPATVNTLVLDEFDKSLELGFQDEMGDIIVKIKQLRHTIMTSATKAVEIPPLIDMAGAVTLDYTDLTVESGHSAATPTLTKMKVTSPARDKLDTLVALLRSLDNERTIVFVNHREAAERVYDRLRQERVAVVLYHGGLDQLQRQRALITFTNGTTPVLVATDLAARGLDIDGVGTVIHYHLPGTAEAWTHRNGRTARQGASGSVYVIVSEADAVPEFVATDGEYDPTARSSRPLRAKWSTIYFDAGRREKISRGDIVGFLIAKGGLQADEIGRIDLTDHAAYAAVRPDKARQIVASLAGEKIKNKKVRISLLKV